MRIGAVVSYCSNEYRFLSLCISELKKVCDEIVVAAGERLFNGEAEDRELLHRGYFEEKNTQFIEYKCDSYGIYPICEGAHHLHGASRYAGYYALSQDVDAILFVDSDEIIDGDRLRERVRQGVEAVSFLAGYVYARDE